MPDQELRVENEVTSPGLYIASVFLQPNPNENAINVTVRGLPPPGVGDRPRVFLQVREGPPGGRFPDQFSTQVLELDLDREFLVFRIMRLDAKGGWGQRLHVQILLEHFVEGG
jgi:hypothetical protein